MVYRLVGLVELVLGEADQVVIWCLSRDEIRMNVSWSCEYHFLKWVALFDQQIHASCDTAVLFKRVMYWSATHGEKP